LPFSAIGSSKISTERPFFTVLTAKQYEKPVRNVRSRTLTRAVYRFRWDERLAFNFLSENQA